MMTFDWKPLSRCLLLLLVLVAAVRASTSQSARVSQRLVGGHAKVATGGSKSNDTEDKQEEKKTLSQQVAEGKYGLIQTELFERRPTRPGVLSYERNAEVPRDDENTLGGLGTDEIWLAEDHLLVLKGGAFHRTASEMPWQPIDDYVAPGRQVKIPSRPKVPPPFPVQLAEGGPVQYLGADAATRTVDGTRASAGDGTATPHPPTYQNPADITSGRAPFQIPALPPNSRPENFNRGDGPGPFPFPIPPPRPPLNQSIDYDDPSIYYPPPYSFYYHADNNTEVPPGPLVPGIVLPPPPDFFGQLDDTTKPPGTTPGKEQITTTPPPTVVVITQSHRRPVPKKTPIRYLPYNENMRSTTPPAMSIPTTTESYENDLQEQETPTVHVPTTPAPKTPTISSVPVVHVPYPTHQQRRPPSIDVPPTNFPIVTNVPVLNVPYKQHVPPNVVSIISISAKKPSTPNRYVRPTAATVPVLRAPYNDQPRTYLTPTSPQVVDDVGLYKQRPRTYLTPTTRPHSTRRPQISVTIESVPYKEHPTKSQLSGTVGPIVQLQYADRPRTYLKPTVRPQVGHTVSPVTVHYVTYDDRNQKARTRLKPTTKPQLVHTVPTIVRVPYVQGTRTQVSSSAVPLKNYFSSADVETNSVQPQRQVDYYFYEEDVTEPPQQRYVQPTNFDRHVQQLRQKIQSYLKPTSKPVYEYSFQAANYQPTSPTPAPYQPQYVTTNRYQEAPPNRGYYTKHDERVLDDITNKYFTTFGQKLTTPVTPIKSLAGDTLVNYRQPRPQTNPAAEFIDERAAYKKPPGTYISYQLPGEGAHFYFLTPQLVKQQRNVGLEQQEIAQRQYEQQRLEQERFEQQQQRYDQQRLEQQRVEEGRYRQPDDPDVGYYYPKPNNQKVPRRNER